jgi:uncharacterized protein (DUF1330 family)
MFGGQVIAGDASTTTLEGEGRGRAVILRVPNREADLKFYNSEEYQMILPQRLDATSDNWLGIVNAFEPPADR